LTASASPASGSALRSKSSAAQDTGGVISAVMANCRARNSASRREAGCCAVIVLSGGLGAAAAGARHGAPMAHAAYISDRRGASEPCNLDS
jgi:hypothetical protein